MKGIVVDRGMIQTTTGSYLSVMSLGTYCLMDRNVNLLVVETPAVYEHMIAQMEVQGMLYIYTQFRCQNIPKHATTYP